MIKNLRSGFVWNPIGSGIFLIDMKNKVYLKRIANKNSKELNIDLRRIFIASGINKIIQKDGFVGIKLTFGEEQNKGYINPVIVKEVIDLVKKVKGKPFIVETNTLYRGNRSNAVDHLNLAIRHGFNPQDLGAPLIIGDGLLGYDQFELEVNLKYFKKLKLASVLKDADCVIALSHVTGHILTGFAGVLKNIGMGLASRAGKLNQHSNVLPVVKPKKCNGCTICVKKCPVNAIVINSENKAFILKDLCIGCGDCTVLCRFDAIEISWSSTSQEMQEKMVEYASGVLRNKQGRFGCINFIIHFTKECDCMSTDTTSIINDIGILASFDPVAIDKASVDVINNTVGKDIFKEFFPNIDYSVQLKYAEEIGVGSTKYDLIEV